MITYIKGDLLTATDGIIAHGCNAQGVMGSGVALQIKEKFPEAYADYLKMPKTLGTVGYTEVSQKLTIANCITQEFYGRDKNVRYVSYDALELVFKQLGMLHGYTINIPMIGAGLANGDWNTILNIINRHTQHSKVFVYVL